MKPLPSLAIAGGAVAVLVLLAAVFLGGRAPAPVTPSARTVPPSKSPAAQTPPREETLKLAAARQALADALRPGLAKDVDAAYAAWELAVRAAGQTPLEAEALQGLTQAGERRRTAWKTDLEEGEQEILAALDRKDPPGARGFLENLRGRRKGTEWAAKAEEIARRLGPALAAAEIEARPWTPLFDGKSRDFLRSGGDAAVEGGLLLASNPESALQTRREFSDGELRARFEIVGGETLYFSVRQGAEGAWTYRWDQSRGIAQLEGSLHELHFVMKGPAVRATLDGRELVPQLEGKSARGCFQFNLRAAAFKLHSLEFRELP